MSCSAANAVIDVIEEDNLAENARVQGERLRAGLEELQKRYPKSIGDVRGKGLMQAIEIVVDEPGGDRTPDGALVARVFEAAKERGLLIGKGGLHGNVFRIAPALTVTAQHIDEGLKLLGEAFAEVCS